MQQPQQPQMPDSIDFDDSQVQILSTDTDEVAIKKLKLSNKKLRASNTLLSKGQQKRQRERWRDQKQKQQMVGSLNNDQDYSAMVPKSASEELKDAAFGFWHGTCKGKGGSIGKLQRQAIFLELAKSAWNGELWDMITAEV